MVYGNKEKDRQPINAFIKEVNEYPRLLEIMTSITGLINKRSSHASGVIFLDEDPYEFGCFMKTPKGEVITQWDLHDCEYAGMTKYDLLLTEVTDKIIQAINLLQEDNIIEKGSLRQIYNKYLHPQKIDLNNKKIWEALSNGDVLDCFQFSTDVGLIAAKKIKPQNPEEMTAANALMRLMPPDKKAENPIDKYVRFKKDFPNKWIEEMKKYGVTEEEKKLIADIYEPSYGCPSIQEDLMVILMKTANFSLAEANDARKIVGKKLMSRIPELKEHIFNNIEHKEFAQYIWDTCIKVQLGYAFNRSHSLPYSFVGIQTLFIATNWNPIYWNTACLIVNSGSLEENEEENEEEKEEEDKREKSTDYAKLARALGDIVTKNIKVSLIDINKSSYGFKPDVENNQILFGMKALRGVGTQVIEQIISNRPYKNFNDFLNRCPLDKTSMISLIKSGSFDKLEIKWAKELKIEPRILIMVYYLYKVSDLKNRITLQNLNGLINRNLLPPSLDFQRKIFEFNKYLKTKKIFDKINNKNYYYFNNVCEKFYSKHFDINKLNVVNGVLCILKSDWDKIYNDEMEKIKDWMKENQNKILDEFNNLIFFDNWNKYAKGTVAFWEMESLCFYYHDHELKNIDKSRYGISNFFKLPEQPEVEYFFKKNKNEIPIYKIHKIIGTVISKDDTHSSVSILTTEGVVTVKFTKEYYAMFNKQLSEIQSDGTKKVIEKSWFTRGTKIMVVGFRKEDTFIARTYKNSQLHKLYKIVEIKKSEIVLSHERYSKEENRDG